ncbi:sugar ABC transporter substrate-binding protein [Trinickia dinghuensis]|uniref:Sugar ABC transporter substrate-binding protein n=1 Tax=Trinickia dinghuensis TaxID=2291023 RepID=A0A3D8K6T1_9BURK|nr:sugar ABC transporter substrate-binding protein [Trinickia dinghuensis]RDV00920.1 sugar ABC transporter substrate-binding protein [Trinickia dinghuensis]
MKRLTKLACSLALVSLSATAISASAATIGVTMNRFNDTFAALLRNSMKQEGAAKGANVEFEDAQQDIGRQISQIQNFIAQKVDAIVVALVDTDVSPKITKMATAAGIPLVYVNLKPADPTLPPKVTFVGSKESEAGKLEMSEVCRLLGGKGDVVILMGDLSHEATRERTQSAEDVTKTPACQGIKVVDKQSAKWSRTAAQDLMTNWLSSGTQFNAVVANNDEMALGAIQALKAAKRLNGTVVAGIDATSDALAAMKAGELKATVFQDASGQGKGAIDAALSLAHGENVPSVTYLPFQLVTPANRQQFAGRN